MRRLLLSATAAVVSLVLSGLCPPPAGADPASLGATGDATFARDVLHASGPVLVEFGEYG